MCVYPTVADRKSDFGVVISTSEKRRASVGYSETGTFLDRTATLTSGRSVLGRTAARPMTSATSGECKCWLLITLFTEENVERPQETREGLARVGCCDHERVGN